MTKSDSNQERIKKIIDSGSEIIGGGLASAAGAVAGGFLAGPAGIAVGGAAGATAQMAMRKAGSEISARMLSGREEQRIGALLVLSAEKLNKAVGGGRKLREDDFFEDQGADRSKADEFLESVIIRIQKEPQENKIKYAANFLCNVCFNEKITLPMTHYYDGLIAKLSWRQLCLISIYRHRNDLKLVLSPATIGSSSYPEGSEDWKYILQEMLDLIQRGILQVQGGVYDHWTHVRPQRCEISNIGFLFSDLLELNDLSDDPEYKECLDALCLNF